MSSKTTPPVTPPPCTPPSMVSPPAPPSARESWTPHPPVRPNSTPQRSFSALRWLMRGGRGLRNCRHYMSGYGPRIMARSISLDNQCEFGRVDTRWGVFTGRPVSSSFWLTLYLCLPNWRYDVTKSKIFGELKEMSYRFWFINGFWKGFFSRDITFTKTLGAQKTLLQIYKLWNKMKRFS